MPTVYTPRVVVKFGDALIDIKIPDAVERFQTQLKDDKIDGTAWTELIARFKDIVIEPLLTALSQERLLDLINLASKSDPQYRVNPSRLLTYFSIPCPPNMEPEELVKLLSGWKAVETAYLEEGPADEPGVTPCRNPALRQIDTAYLRPAPAGIDAYYAWNRLGGDGGKGDGVALQLFDIESNWDITHPELKPANPQWTKYGDNTVRGPGHGTKVLGIIIGSDQDPPAPYNGSSMGITPNVATTLLASYWKNRTEVDHYNTILFAIDKLNYGDVLLLETQISILDRNGNPIKDANGNELANLPVEYRHHNFQAIKLATALGIAVIEPAGNYKHDLGTLGKSWLKRSRNEAEDSGAIIVTAASPWDSTPQDYIHLPILTGGGERCHNFGDRIDCYAWGDQIYTTSSDGNGNYSYGNFGDTSGSSAIIAGVALALQGMAEKKLGRRFSPGELRTILSDPATGTLAGSKTAPPNRPIPQNWNQHKIGVMPDLKTICVQKLGL